MEARNILFLIICIFSIELYSTEKDSISVDSCAIYLNKSKESRLNYNYREAIQHLIKGMEYCQCNKQKAEIYNSFGRNYFELSDYYTAINYYDSALIYVDTNHNSLYLGYLYNNFGLCYAQLMNFREALNYYQKATRKLDNESVGVLYYNISKLYGYLNLEDSANYYLNKAYQHNLHILGDSNYYTILAELALTERKLIFNKDLEQRILRKNNSELKGHFYSMVGKYNLAEQHLQQDNFLTLELYVKSKQWSKAVEIVDSLRNSLTSLNAKLFLQANEHLIYKNAIDNMILSDTLKAFKIAIKSHANVLREKIEYKLDSFPSSYNYFDFDSVIYLFVVNDQIEFFRINVDSVFLSKYEKFINSFNLRHILDSFMLNFRDYAEGAYYLSKTLVPYYSQDMLIIPDGRLLNIPFEALLTDWPDTTKYPIYKELPYALRKADIHYDYLLRDYKPATGLKRIVAFAPDKSLDFSIKEVEGIRGYNSKIYIGEKAKTKKIFEGDIIHIATHYNPVDYKIKFSDGYIDLDTLKKTSFNLAVLSTCYSGLGKQYIGEGSFSAGRAFYETGSESVIESLWTNDDRSAYLIFGYFYSFLNEGYLKSSALKQAKLKHLTECPSYLSHPFFWGNLRVFGNNSILKIKKQFPYRKIIIGLFIAIVAIQYFMRINRKKTSLIN